MTLDRRDAAQRRVMVMAAVVGLALLVIVVQLWYLQVISGDHFREASDKNRMRVRPVAAPRGILYDRHHVPLVDNRPAFTLSLIPRELDEDDDRAAVLGRVSALLAHSVPGTGRRRGARSGRLHRAGARAAGSDPGGRGQGRGVEARAARA